MDRERNKMQYTEWHSTESERRGNSDAPSNMDEPRGGILLDEMSQTQKDEDCVIPLTWGI